jgi:hypothetical protein
MLDPDGLPVAARIAFDRVWPVKGTLEVSGPGGGPVEILGVDERMRLADLLGEEIPEGEILTEEDPDGPATP